MGTTGVRSCYDEGKRTAETLTMDYHRGAQVEALRKAPLTVYGDGKQTRSFQYVSDLVGSSTLFSTKAEMICLSSSSLVRDGPNPISSPPCCPKIASY
ncbi:hypothetical protein GW17_00008548 [Ensete ventricosum]|nr:hypothetical protein GW17_00008548 [Ensete ventricosum]